MINKIRTPRITPERLKVVVYEEGQKVHKAVGSRKNVISSMLDFFKNK